MMEMGICWDATGEPELPEKTPMLPGPRACPTQVINGGYAVDQIQFYRILKHKCEERRGTKEKVFFLSSIEGRKQRRQPEKFASCKGNAMLIGRPEGKRPLGRLRRRWVDNIKMDLREVGYDGRDWINLAQDRDQWRAYVRATMNIRVP
ncbi:hypothetical protein ANN_13120 [Periplaneta americana]|uniref:Uncharacterized protein n=1 Tax=Periplaneta americana TaxID=6978 RepID=A0ABQ8TIJ0_PERAM|nr:hypothetical protein ANN_13120 [Periplaneta americana]